jgi:hypothetical protein
MTTTLILTVIVSYGLVALALFVMIHRVCTSFLEARASVGQDFARACALLREHGSLLLKLQCTRAGSTAEIETSANRS